MKIKLSDKNKGVVAVWSFAIFTSILMIFGDSVFHLGPDAPGFIILSCYILFAAIYFFKVRDKDSNPRHSIFLGKVSLIVFVIFWLIALFVMFQDRFDTNLNNAIGVSVLLPLLLITFLGAPIILIIFSIKSFKEGVSYGRRGRKVVGVSAKFQAILYFLIGIAWLSTIIWVVIGVMCTEVCDRLDIFIHIGQNSSSIVELFY